MRKANVIALSCADIHLSLKPPIARSAEPDWLMAMARPLRELSALASAHGDVPILCAGDVFNYWLSPPELINFALEELPQMYAIPGQHDLPHHSLEDIRKSAYWTLVKTDKITNVAPDYPLRYTGKGAPRFYGFPWGSVEDGDDMSPDGDDIEEDVFAIALVHAYCWKPNYSYKDPPEGTDVKSYWERLFGFKVAVFGDNHQGFVSPSRQYCRPTIVNCGGFMRRRADEVNYKPTVGILYDDGSVKRHELDCSEDKFVDNLEQLQTIESAVDLTAFVEELEELGVHGLDFREVLRRHIEKARPSKQVRRMIDAAMEEAIGGNRGRGSLR